MASHGYGETLVSCGFEPTGDTWSFTYAGQDYASSNAGGSDFPPNQRIINDASGSTRSWQVTSAASSTLTFSELLLSGWNNVLVRYHVSSTASSGSSGHTPMEQVAAYVALSAYTDQSAPVFGDTPDIKLTGYGAGATWGYNSGAPEQVKDAGWGRTFAQKDAGLRTSDGYTDLAIRIPEGQRSLSFKIFAQNNAGGKSWNLDDVTLEGTATTSSNRWWDGDGKNQVGGGAGVWDNVSTRWASTNIGNTYAAWNGANGDNAYFTQTGGPVTIAAGSTVAARSLTFSANGYTVTAGDSQSHLALTAGGSGGAGPGTIEVTNPGDTARVNVTIIGNPGVGLTKIGAGTLVLGGCNTYTGATTVGSGTLVLAAQSGIHSTSIDVSYGATLDLSAVGPFTIANGTTLKGSGTIVGNLVVAGTHAPGNSVGIETVQGDYTMNGILEMAISGSEPGIPTGGYDQVVISGNSHNVSLQGSLLLTWSGSNWSSAHDRLWIICNSTAGTLAGAFSNYGNGALVGSYDGRPWHIYYGADAGTGALTGGNDVLLAPATLIPEPSSFVLLLMLVATAWCARWRRD